MDKNYEEYIAELETELSDAKRERDEAKHGLMIAEDTIAELVSGEDTAVQDAITAWSMGFE